MNIRKNKAFSRKHVVKSLLVMVLFGAFFGIAIKKVFEVSGIDSLQNLSICIILYTLGCIFCWLPLVVPSQQIAQIDEDYLYIMPKYNSMKKMKIAWYALMKNTIQPFYRSIPLKDISKITFTFDSQFGAYAYKRFSFQFRIHVGEEEIVIFINPGQNGPIFPSGHGIPFVGTLSKSEIVNLLAFFHSVDVKVNDPYKLEDALKNENVVLYDYLSSLQKNMKF